MKHFHNSAGESVFKCAWITINSVHCKQYWYTSQYQLLCLMFLEVPGKTKKLRIRRRIVKLLYKRVWPEIKCLRSFQMLPANSITSFNVILFIWAKNRNKIKKSKHPLSIPVHTILSSSLLAPIDCSIINVLTLKPHRQLWASFDSPQEHIFELRSRVGCAQQ